MKIPFVKMNGCGNDYLYVDNLSGSWSESLGASQTPEIARKVSDRKTGVGSDGLIVLDPPSAEAAEKGAKIRMRMYNADGSEGKMCGNGIRCVARLAAEKWPDQKSYWIETASGLKECFILDKGEASFQVRVNMGRPNFLPARIPVLFEDDVMVMDEEFEVLDREFKISCVGMGNPHCVIEVENLESFEVEKYGPAFEKHEVFPEGVNVEFIDVLTSDKKVMQRTWERGSGETKACGTGACAVGVAQIFKKKRKSPVEIELKGGTLKVEWDGLREVWLTGNAVKEFVGEFEV